MNKNKRLILGGQEKILEVVVLDRELRCFSESNFENNFLVYFDKEKDFDIKGVEIVNFYEFQELIYNI